MASFVPQDLDAGKLAQLTPLYQALIDREILSAEALEDWLTDYAQLSAVVSEYGTRRSIDQSCHTDDEAILKRYMCFVEQVRPSITSLSFKIEEKYLQCPFVDQLADEKFKALTRGWRADNEIYRDENIPLQTEMSKLSTQYDQICGNMLVDFQGKQHTLQQLARFLEEPDRSVRQQAWRISSERRLQDREGIDNVFDQMLDCRAQMAHNAGLDNYRSYTWKSFNRFDYTPDDCIAFSKTIEQVCMPLVTALNREHQAALQVDRLRPWDLAVDPKGRPPLEPFPSDKPLEMLAKIRAIFAKISPPLASQFAKLKPGRNLDLDSRKGKRPGGYQSSLEQIREPFIFMNAAGSHRDVETMLHEAGHAFHYMAACDEPMVFLRHSPLEFAEVASMSMELLGCDYLDEFYTPADVARAKRQQFEGILRFFPWMATIDSFQHWIYTHPKQTAETRTQAWLEIFGAFSDDAIDWTDCQDAKASRWHAQLHLFKYPFYYVEYGIAQLGALQVWQNYRKNPQDALAKLQKAFALGGTRPLPELFDTAGIRFDFSLETLKPLMQAVQDELASLPQ